MLASTLHEPSVSRQSVLVSARPNSTFLTGLVPPIAHGEPESCFLSAMSYFAIQPADLRP